MPKIDPQKPVQDVTLVIIDEDDQLVGIEDPELGQSVPASAIGQDKLADIQSICCFNDTNRPFMSGYPCRIIRIAPNLSSRLHKQLAVKGDANDTIHAMDKIVSALDGAAEETIVSELKKLDHIEQARVILALYGSKERPELINKLLSMKEFSYAHRILEALMVFDVASGSTEPAIVQGTHEFIWSNRDRTAIFRILGDLQAVQPTTRNVLGIAKVPEAPPQFDTIAFEEGNGNFISYGLHEVFSPDAKGASFATITVRKYDEQEVARNGAPKEAKPPQPQPEPKASDAQDDEFPDEEPIDEPVLIPDRFSVTPREQFEHLREAWQSGSLIGVWLPGGRELSPQEMEEIFNGTAEEFYEKFRPGEDIDLDRDPSKPTAEELEKWKADIEDIVNDRSFQLDPETAKMITDAIMKQDED